MTYQEAPYIYKWDIWTNNLAYGYKLVGRYNTLEEARANINCLQNKNGCCEIVKRRYYIKEVERC